MFRVFALIFFFINFLLKGNSQLIHKYEKLLPKDFYTQSIKSENNAKSATGKLAGELYLDLGRNSLTHNEDLALEYEKIAKEIFISLGLDSMVMLTNLSMSFPYINTGQYDNAESIIKDVIDYSVKNHLSNMNASAYLRYGYLEHSRGNFDKALIHYLKSYNWYLKNKPINELGDITNRIGITYKEIGDCNTSLKYLNNYLNLLKEKNLKSNFEIPIRENMTECYLLNNDVGKAKMELNTTISIRKNSKSYKLLAKSYLSLFQLSILENKIQAAEKYLDTALYYGKKFKSERILAELHLHKAEIILKTKKQSKEVLEALLTAKKLAMSSQTPKTNMHANAKIAEYYLNNNNYKEAIFYDKQADSLKGKLYSTDVISAINNLEKEMIKTNSEEKINLLQQQNELKNENLIKEKRINRIVSLMIVLLLALLSLLSYILYQRSKNNKLLDEKNKTIEKSLQVNKMLVKEVHHRVKNNLQIVASLLGLQSRYANDKNVHEAVVSSKTRVQAMSLLHQSLYMNEDLKLIPIKKYFEDLCENLENTYKSEMKDVSLKYKIEDLNIDLDKVVTLGLIVNELIINSMKHAFKSRDKGHINLIIEAKGERINCIVGDDGMGLPFDILPEKPTSMGMQIISSFLKKLDADVVIENKNGTTFKISFNIIDTENG